MPSEFSGMKVGDFTESSFSVKMRVKVRLGHEWEVGKWRHKVETILFFLELFGCEKQNYRANKRMM